MTNHIDVIQIHGIRYRVLMQDWSSATYTDKWLCVLDTFYGQILQQICYLHYRIMPAIAHFEARRLKMQEGTAFPKWSLITPLWWINVAVKRLATPVSPRAGFLY